MAAKKDAVASGKVVKYVGTADVRRITEREWREAGVADQGDVTWDRSNGFTVPVADLKDDAVVYCDEVDAGFVLTDADT